MGEQGNQLYEFGPFRLDPRERILWRDGSPVLLPPKAFDLLVLLVERSGRLVGKDELMGALWPESFVEEANLTHHVWVLRKALVGGQDGRPYIETVPKRGYRFATGVVRRHEGGAPAGEKPTRPSLVPEASQAQHEKRARRGLRVGVTISITILFLLGLEGALFGLWMWGKPKWVSSDKVIKSIAVLPFKPLSQESEDQYLGLGLADALITKLSRLGQVITRPPSAVRKFAGPAQDALAAGRELRVESVLEGSIQRLADRVRVDVRLVRVSDGQVLWADQFDDQLANIFALEDLISERAATALTLGLTGAEKARLTKHHTDNPEAYQLYLEGSYYFHKGAPEGWEKSIWYFRQAIEKDPRYVLPYTKLAMAYCLLNDFGVLAPREAVPEADQAARKAMELDDTLPDAHVTAAFIKSLNHWDWAGAERELKRAIELAPTYSPAHNTYGHLLVGLGRMEEALAESRLALELDPSSASMSQDLAWCYFMAGRYDQAIEQCRRTLEMDANGYRPHLYLGWIYEQQGEYAEAIAALQRAKTLSAASLNVVASLAHAYAVSGQRSEAERILAELRDRAKKEYVSPYYLAVISAGLGQKDRALELLEKACQERSAEISALKSEPRFKGLREDARFQTLLRHMGLAR